MALGHSSLFVLIQENTDQPVLFWFREVVLFRKYEISEKLTGQKRNKTACPTKAHNKNGIPLPLSENEKGSKEKQGVDPVNRRERHW